jgi:hypothetical protein
MMSWKMYVLVHLFPGTVIDDLNRCRQPSRATLEPVPNNASGSFPEAPSQESLSPINSPFSPNASASPRGSARLASRTSRSGGSDRSMMDDQRTDTFAMPPNDDLDPEPSATLPSYRTLPVDHTSMIRPTGRMRRTVSEEVQQLERSGTKNTFGVRPPGDWHD